MTIEKNSIESLGYRQHPAIANSDLKYLHSPRLFKLKKDRKILEEPTDAQKTGTLIDEFLLNRENFSNNFTLDPELKDVPTSGHQEKFVEEIMTYDNYEDLDEELVYSIHNDIYSTSSVEKANKMYNEFKPYMRHLENTKDKTVYTPEERLELIEIEKNCRRDKQVNRFLFDPKKGDQVFKHLQIIGMEKWGVEWKGELDLVVINHVDKEIYNIDLKSTSGAIAYFGYGYYKKWNYKRQQALYRLLLWWWLKKQKIIRNPEEWTMKTRCIVVQSRPLFECACIPIPNQVLLDGEEELSQAAKDINFYRKNGWDHTKSYIKNDGLELIDWSQYRDNN